MIRWPHWRDNSLVFCVSIFQKSIGKFAASIERSKAQSVSVSGGRGLHPLTH